MPIHVLEPAVANQIAAGEVVERPASAVKELIENSLDAGASDIRVEIREGGRRLIRVQDDGGGIPAAETGLLFLRHATSKISRAEDLDRLTTLGFRGEALASIGSVAHVTLLTCARGEASGTLLRVNEGREVSREGRGAPPGTTITVEHLFAGVPARLKFLKQAATEAGHVYQIVTRYALAYPDRRFSLVSDGKLQFQSTGSGKLYDVLIKVYGLETARQMLAVGAKEGRGDAETRGRGEEPDTDTRGLVQQAGGVAPLQGPLDLSASPRPRVPASLPQVTGYVGVPALHRSTRSYISLFINRRWFQDQSLAYAVIQAYHTLLPVGRYPVGLIFIEIDPADVDVNVHPTKAEVRFRDAHPVFGAVQRAVRQTLTEHAPIPDVSLGAPDAGEAGGIPEQLAWDEAGGHWSAPPGQDQDAWSTAARQDEDAWASRRQVLLNAGHNLERGLDEPAADRLAAGEPGAVPLPAAPDLASAKIPILRVVGQVATMYIVAEGPDGLYLIDQHAAHERILYEQMLAEKARDAIAVQPLLAPLPVELTPEQAATVAQELPILEELGIHLEPFGSSTYLLRTVPALLSRDDPGRALAEIVDGLTQRTNVVEGAREARLVTLICKRAAIKGGQAMSLAEMQELVRRLELCRSPRTCPHGRPTMVHVSGAELAKHFGRI